LKQMKIEWIHEGFQEILCSEGVGKVCEEQAKRIQENANSELTSETSLGFSMGGRIVNAYGSKRWMYFVNTTDYATMCAEAIDQALSKAVN